MIWAVYRKNGPFVEVVRTPSPHEAQRRMSEKHKIRLEDLVVYSSVEGLEIPSTDPFGSRKNNSSTNNTQQGDN